MSPVTSIADALQLQGASVQDAALRETASGSAEAQANGTDISRLERLLLLEHVLGRPRESLIAHADDPLEPTLAERFRGLLARRRLGEPIAYLVGHREFFGLSLQVDERVLIPRPETELLAEAAISWAPEAGAILDLGTGSGAIAIAVAHARPDLEVSGSDISAGALALAEANARRLLAHRPRPVLWLQARWWEGLPETRWGVVVANPPYLASTDPHLHTGDLRFEPQLALSDGEDGLAAIRAVMRGFAQRADRGLIGAPGLLFVEHGATQAVEVRRLGEALGLKVRDTLHDLSGLPRVGCLAAPSLQA
jgi:release factor glutamine methyltransferase